MKAPKLVLLTSAVFLSLAGFSQTDSTKTDTTGTKTDSTAKDSTQLNLRAGIISQSNGVVTTAPKSNSNENQRTASAADFRKYYVQPKSAQSNTEA